MAFAICVRTSYMILVSEIFQDAFLYYCVGEFCIHMKLWSLILIRLLLDFAWAQICLIMVLLLAILRKLFLQATLSNFKLNIPPDIYFIYFHYLNCFRMKKLFIQYSSLIFSENEWSNYILNNVKASLYQL